MQLAVLMPTILDQIVVSKRQELEAARARLSESALQEQVNQLPGATSVSASQPGRFHASLLTSSNIGVIAEVKRQSPSAGAIQAGADAVTMAKQYAEHGAACISVLTDNPHFGGSLDDLRAVRAVVKTPLLRKDFILERYQVLEARLAGADAVLLIAEILDDPTMASLLHEIQQLGMDALVECYEASNIARVLESGATLIGINNRDLHSFVVKLEHTLELARLVPKSCTLVSESGIKSRTDVERLAASGIKAILVGETLMKAPNLPQMLHALSTVPKQS